MPQANKLENVRQLAAAVRDGISHRAALMELLSVDARHYSYYRQAALVLRVLAESADEGLKLTEHGRRLLGTVERSADERQCFRDLILSAPSLRPFSSFFEGSAATQENIAFRLASMAGLSQSTAERRAQTLFQWRRYIGGDDATRGRAAPEPLPDITAEFEGRIARHNALAKQRYIEHLLTVEPKHFEELVAKLATAMGYQQVKVQGGAGDGGVDVTATKVDEWGHSAAAALQVKRYAKPIARKIVHEMMGVIASQRCRDGVLITTSEFSQQALDVAKDEPRLRLVDGAQLVELMVKHGVELRLGKFGEILLP